MRTLLLMKDVTSLGYIGDVVKVADGYARNYLIPQGLALEPTDVNMRKIEQAKKQAETWRAKELAEKKAVASRMDGLELTLVAKATDQGHLFGSVGPKEIADALRDEGYNIDEKQIQLGEHIKLVDKYTVPVRLAEDVTAELVVWVAPEKSQEDEDEDQAGESDPGPDSVADASMDDDDSK